MTETRADVAIVGAGPAGIAAACAASEDSGSVLVMDDNPAPGGQIWRGRVDHRWMARLDSSGAILRNSTRVIGAVEPGLLLVEQDNGEPLFVHFGKLILASGARELLLPFPGWTLPGVTGAGGLQALVQGGVPISGKRVVVAGSGPLLLAVAVHLREHGARVQAIAEQAPLSALAHFMARLPPAKLLQAWRLRSGLRDIPLLTDAWPIAAEGDGRLRSVHLHTRRGNRQLDCDYLACGFGLVPNVELARLMGCDLRAGFVAASEWQETSVADVLCAGEPTGIGGLERSLAEGEIAGHVAVGKRDRAQALFRARKRMHRFSQRLAAAFALRDELRALCQPDTIVCRCEDVAWGRVAAHSSWRSAKLHTRCGMGPCQGRVCGAAVNFLKGWPTPAESMRPPLYPVSAGVLASWQPTSSSFARPDEGPAQPHPPRT